MEAHDRPSTGQQVHNKRTRAFEMTRELSRLLSPNQYRRFLKLLGAMDIVATRAGGELGVAYASAEPGPEARAGS